MKNLFLALTLCIVLSGCQSPNGQRWTKSEIYFGLSKPDGSLISAAEWQQFVDEVVTPLFPAGLSVMDAAGQWKGNDGKVIHESSKVLVLMHPPGREARERIDSIRSQYCTRFSQEAVMKVTTKTLVAF